MPHLKKLLLCLFVVEIGEWGSATSVKEDHVNERFQCFWVDLHYFERIGIMPVICNVAMKITDTCIIPIPASAQLNRLIRYTFPAFKNYYDVRRTIMVKKKAKYGS